LHLRDDQQRYSSAMPVAVATLAVVVVQQGEAVSQSKV